MNGFPFSFFSQLSVNPLNAAINPCAGIILGGALHLIPYRKTPSPNDREKKRSLE